MEMQFINNFDMRIVLEGLNCVICSESAADYLGMSNRLMREKDYTK